jgi:hypothetical protein
MDTRDIHRLDQSMAEFRDHLAPILYAYCSALVDAGFNEDQAFQLTLAFQQWMLESAGRKSNPPDNTA